MDYKITYTNSADNDLAKLEKDLAKRIITKLNFFLQSKNPLEYAKKLKGLKLDTYRYRIGDYRVIFRLNKENNTIVILVILRILHRKSVYN
ncbi:type II toxin-antitoxin system RelE/ParE family toxin [Candidatus Peregrinibacteria bacterium]|nr:type II toxin-antitoxin system RelE/ParE family toxin [Candidatus Peregrinibacteria bacterium]